MSTCQLKMSQSFAYASVISSSRSKPSNCGSGLAEMLRNTLQSSPTVMPAPEPQPLQEEKKKKRIIVIGAGISGLRAASTLQRHGVDVVVLEARDRIGGRICTTRNGGQTTWDLGAAWMHETSQNPLVKLIRALGIEYYYDDGTPLYYTAQGRAGAQFKAKKVADEFADYVDWYYKAHPDAEDRSVDDFMQEFISRHELITQDERLWAPQAVREIEQWIATGTAEASCKYLQYFITERNLYMKGGYDRIVDWTAGPLLESPHALQLNHRVTRVAWSDNAQGQDAVRVECEDATGCCKTVTGDAVIVTVPLGALHHKLLTFDPPLPDDIQHGFSQLSYGALGKIFFEFSEVFWSKDNDQIIYYPSPPELNEDGADFLGSSPRSSSSRETPEDNILNYPTVTVNLMLVADRRELCVQIAEPLTQRIEAMTDPKKRYKFFEPLFKLIRTEPYKALPRLIKMECTQWTQDPLAGFGTYSCEKVGDNPHLIIAALENHRHSVLQFAGEHLTRVGQGCVHGAFATGEKAAKRLLEKFKVSFKGDDIVSVPS
ncbi:hypothetical protein N7510_003278 [Penicillium lagena]|uniref:uncharacterized protein n=1 Tax=Penicillium lagena TaxID=94218 RepID=UPI00253FB3BF|nr:uncharacterized protein N7510_003278 [Penicillium lagena]KAJ5619294.1 hypothetical protein N7510_003278 [Penicillium lagena]